MKPLHPPFFPPKTRPAHVALALAAALVAAGLPAHAAEPGSPFQQVGLTGVQGSGKLQTEQRNVGSFQAVDVHASMNVVLRQGAREAVELRADDNLLALVETRVISRSGVPTLEIRMRDHTSYSARNPITLTVDLVTLSSLSVRGSGNVSGDGLKVPALKIAVAGSGNVKLQKLSLDEASLKISGSGNAELAGKAGRLGIAISGSGDINTRELEADEVGVRIAGSGDASVNARKTLSVSIAGSGDVEYTGDATLKTSIAGSGHVKKR
ncbi:MAG: head GIN domain-containing protein [Burkholderiaceae bacterium]